MKSEAEVIEFQKVFLQLRELLSDFVELSKKKPNDPVNLFKIKFANELISRCNKIFGKNKLPISEFTLFQSEDLPSNSDVVLVLNQYKACMRKHGIENTQYSKYDSCHFWVILGKVSSVKADLHDLNR